MRVELLNRLEDLLQTMPPKDMLFFIVGVFLTKPEADDCLTMIEEEIKIEEERRKDEANDPRQEKLW